MNRRWELDLLRGLMLVLMYITHMPTRFSSMLGQPFGYVSAAEGFVMLSAFMAGMIYTSKAERDGIPAMRNAFLARALKIYACHAALLLLLFTIIAALGISRDEPALKNLIGFYLEQPLAGLTGGLLLIYNPPLLDILPLYIVLMLVSPIVLERGLKHGWRGILAVSIVLWAVSQFAVSEKMYDAFVTVTDLQVPYKETGAFETFAWQFLWILGLWMGALTATGQMKNRKPFSRALITACLAFAMPLLIWRYIAGQVPVEGESIINHLFDKWHLGPFRLLNFFALLILIMHFGEWLKAHVPRLPFLQTLGAASLPVFCMHLVAVLLALSVYGESTPQRAVWTDVMLLFGGLACLYVAALITLRFDAEARPKTRTAPG
ncbi:OpgC domain-containing protein [Noviherbaspirillum sp. Root189]|uniref:OpgC domain-containing protein n=1 Tax=Noviherbaspirillum sp. Root189 TaxID=1736487 RepID=UPI00070E2F24|nr:OpgC domain-containing protein [Noviherbaspirillum sp. Root189]KRB87402.1 acyltransferase [Noviherbaspirillum sp. Root189]